jgi:hypothetical protein
LSTIPNNTNVLINMQTCAPVTNGVTGDRKILYNEVLRDLHSLPNIQVTKSEDERDGIGHAWEWQKYG